MALQKIQENELWVKSDLNSWSALCHHKMGNAPQKKPAKHRNSLLQAYLYHVNYFHIEVRPGKIVEFSHFFRN